MSLLTERLPECVEACGRSWAIDPDFRLMVDLESAVTSGAELTAEALGDLLCRFYRNMVPPDAPAAVDALLWFYRCGEEEAGAGGASGRARVYDFDQDAGALYASFLTAFGMDLSTDRVHWWQFRRLMFALPAETPFSQRLHYRTADTSSMGREQKRHYQKMKALYAVRDRSHGRETLAQRDARMRSYVERRFSQAERG